MTVLFYSYNSFASGIQAVCDRNPRDTQRAGRRQKATPNGTAEVCRTCSHGNPEEKTN